MIMMIMMILVIKVIKMIMMIMMMIWQVAGPLVVCIGLLMLAIGILLNAVNSSRRWSFDGDDGGNDNRMMLKMMEITIILQSQ